MENKQINNPTRSELITDFVKSNPEYYIKEFQKIGSKPSFSFSFNLYAGILGPIWFGMRNIWNWALAFLIIETFSVVQIIRGLFGNITKDAVEKIKQSNLQLHLEINSLKQLLLIIQIKSMFISEILNL